MSESLIDALKDLRKSIPLDKLPTYDELLEMRGIYPARQQESEDGACKHCGGRGCVACDARQHESKGVPIVLFRGASGVTAVTQPEYLDQLGVEIGKSKEITAYPAGHIGESEGVVDPYDGQRELYTCKKCGAMHLTCEPRPCEGVVVGEWTGTAQEINQLPELVRQWVHELEARCDPAGDLRARRNAEDMAGAAEQAELRAMCPHCQQESEDDVYTLTETAQALVDAGKLAVQESDGVVVNVRCDPNHGLLVLDERIEGSDFGLSRGETASCRLTRTEG